MLAHLKTHQKQKMAIQQLAWGRNADFQCFPNKSVRVLEENSPHCRFPHVIKNLIFVREKEKLVVPGLQMCTFCSPSHPDDREHGNNAR